MDKYISLKVILDDILDHPLLKDVSMERAINHTINFIKIVGCPGLFSEKTAIVKVEDYRGELPEDYAGIIQVRSKTNEDRETQVFRYSTDNFHMSEDKRNQYDLTYKVQGNLIYTSIKKGDIEIAYRSIDIDDCGFPLIPEDSFFIRALELYIKKQHFTILFDLGKMPKAVYDNVLQEYAWAVGQAQSSLIRPTIDQMQSLTNSLNTLVIRPNEHSTGFINLGSKERLKIH